LEKGSMKEDSEKPVSYAGNKLKGTTERKLSKG